MHFRQHRIQRIAGVIFFFASPGAHLICFFVGSAEALGLFPWSLPWPVFFSWPGWAGSLEPRLSLLSSPPGSGSPFDSAQLYGAGLDQALALLLGRPLPRPRRDRTRGVFLPCFFGRAGAGRVRGRSLWSLPRLGALSVGCVLGGSPRVFPPKL